MIVGLGGFEQVGPDRHGRRRSDQSERRDFFRMPRGGLERDQRTHGMADKPRVCGAGGIEQRGGPVGHLPNGGQRRAA